VARQTRIPASRQALKTSVAPGMAATWPARTAAAYRSSNTSLACCAACSSPRIRRKTSILDWPMLDRTSTMAWSYAAAGRSCVAIAAENASSTLPSSRTVVPAMSRQATVIRVNGTSPPR
jgi:hypothetical protein